jgi:hypothetical protein
LRVKKLNSSKEVLLRINKYRIDWQKDGNSSLEIRFRDLVYPYWRHSLVLFQCTIPGSLLKIDFLNCNKRLAVEINGPQHDKFNKFFHNNSRNTFLAGIRRDLAKQTWLEQNSISLLELTEEDLDYFSPKMIETKYGINIL